MVNTVIDEAKIKELLKQAMCEVLQERRDLIYDVLAEVVEDFALAKAIREGECTESVGKDEILKAL